jgi:hypothetical protein
MPRERLKKLFASSRRETAALVFDADDEAVGATLPHW